MHEYEIRCTNTKSHWFPLYHCTAPCTQMHPLFHSAFFTVAPPRTTRPRTGARHGATDLKLRVFFYLFGVAHRNINSKNNTTDIRLSHESLARHHRPRTLVPRCESYLTPFTHCLALSYVQLIRFLMYCSSTVHCAVRAQFFGVVRWCAAGLLLHGGRSRQ